MTDQPVDESSGVSFDEMLARHQNAEVTENDIMDVAKLFNQVGSSLSSIDQMNVDSNDRAMKLDKNAVLELQAGRSRPDPPPPPVPPVAPVVPQKVHLPSISQMEATLNQSQPTVTVDHKTYDQHIKKLNSVSRKLTKIEKELTNIKSINNVNIKPGKYNIVTSDGVELSATDPTLLLSVISSQLDKKTKEIIITKC